jgi:BirA family biotin operon repressor/biotin-[acetyl-CoA-carboxylase] ligase
LSANKKIGGVLIENMLKGEIFHGSIIGIGINVNQTSFIDLPFASSMLLKTNKKYDLNEVFDELIKDLHLFFELLNEPSKAGLFSTFEKLIYKKGVWSEFNADGVKFFGRIVGVSYKGLLIIEKKSNQVAQYSNGAIEMVY